MNFINLKYFIISILLLFPNVIFGANFSRKEPIVKSLQNITRKLESGASTLNISDHYIIAKYGEEAKYNSGFINGNRKDIAYIIYEGQQINSSFTIKENGYIEIHFLKPVTSLQNFFGLGTDSNVGKIIYVDFSHFNSSSLENVYGIFSYCSNLKEINFTNFDTSKIRNMNSMFAGCNGLLSIDLSNFNTSLVTDMNSMFVGCRGLLSIDLSNFNTSLVKDMNSMFAGCSDLASINLSNFNTSLVTNMQCMFQYCKNLKSLNLSNFNTSSVTNMQLMFYECNQMTMLDLSNFDTSSVTTMEYMFQSCNNLISLNLSNFVAWTVKNTKYMFSNCNKLISINLQNFDIIYADTMSSMFENCNSLEYLEIPNFDFSNPSIMNKIGGVNKIKYINLFNCRNNDRLTIFSNFNNLANLIVCQKDNLINNANAIYACCDFSKNPIKCDYNNYITVKYKEKVEYTSGFINSEIPSRNQISFIINQKSILKNDESFIIDENSTIDIIFSKPVTSLENFFNGNNDTNCKSIIYVDLSHLNSSMLNSTYQMFKQCTSIKEINFTNFQTTSINNMGEMFSDCNQLRSLDLSFFDTSSVTEMSNLFSGCTSLEYLDISYFNTGKLTAFTNMFSDATDIKYINLYNVKEYNNLNKAITEDSNLNNKTSLTVCQKEQIITNANALNECCDFLDYNFKTLSCDPDNYIKVKFKKDVVYSNGFNFVENGKLKNEYRKEVFLIQYENNRYMPNDKLTISKEKEIKIVFKSPMINTTNFFYDYYDPNVEHIISIDLSHFDSSKLQSSDSMFSGCISLEYIDFSNFNSQLLANINNMFYNCNSLKYVDLSDINSSSLTNINGTFYGCTSLKYININNLDLTKVEEASSMFYNVKNLKYIGIYNIKLNDIVKKEIQDISKLNDSDIIVCQNDNIIINSNYNNLCCDFNIEKNECDCLNNIKVYYDERIEYENGFLIDGINSRNNILFIFNDNKIYKANEKLIIQKNTNIKLCLKNSVTSLEKFFDSSLDNNAQNIISIDLSDFNSSSLINIDNIFLGCKKLLALDISNFNFEKIENSINIFNGLENLRYINIYNTKNLNKINLSELIDLNLTVCQNDIIINSTNAKYICCDFNLELKMCHSNNYITVKYRDKTIYLDGFSNVINSIYGYKYYRYGINYIISGNSIFRNDEELTIDANKSIEIHFYPNITSLEDFFLETNCGAILSVDLSHFDSSLITTTQGMFRQCYKIEEINFTNFNTPLLKKVHNMFSYCNNVKSLDLSHFQISKVFSTFSMFEYCSSLQYLDISNFDFSNIKHYEKMFEYSKNLKYINLYNAKNYDFLRGISSVSIILVNQKENLINNENSYFKKILTNCNTNEKPLKCDSNNYITINYKYNVQYPTGFINNIITNRNNIYFINNQNSLFQNNDPLIIEANSSIELHFSNAITSLDNFFNADLDENSKSIIYVDLSNFNSSLTNSTEKMFYNSTSIISLNFSNFETELINDMSGMFSGCSSLELLDLSNFNTKNVSNMSNMFSGCESIISLNLSNFNTESTIDMSDMFYGCSNLEILDISNFNLTKCDSFDNMFSNYDNLKYLDIKHINTDKIFQDSFNNSKLFYICQSEFIINNSYAYNCCEYNIQNHECDYVSPFILDTTIVSTTEQFIFSTSVSNTIPNTIFNNIFTTVPTSISETLQNIIPTTIPNTIPTNASTTIPKTIPNKIETNVQIAKTSIIHNTIPTTILNIIQTTIPTTILDKNQSFISTKVSSTITNIIQTNINTTILGAIPTTTPTKVPKEIPNTIPIATSTTIPKEIPDTYPKINTTITPSNFQSNVSNTYHSSTIFNNITESIINESSKNIDNHIEPIPSTHIEHLLENTTKIETDTDINISSIVESIKSTEIILSKTIIDANSTIIEPNNENTSAVLLGFSNYNEYKSSFSFYTFLLSLKNSMNSKIMGLSASIIHGSNMRVLKETEINCTLNNIINSLNYQYLCEANKDTEIIKSISIKPDFKFYSQNNINIVGISPLAYSLMNNLKLCNEEYDILSSAIIYLLDNSTYNIHEKFIFNITGVIKGIQPKIENKNLSLKFNLQSGEKSVTEVDCVIDEIGGEKYILNCKANKSMEIDLQSGISFIDGKDILIINFDNNTNSIIKIENKISNKRIFFKKQTGLKAGVIAAIIIPILVALISTMFIVYYFRKKNITKKDNSLESSNIIKLMI